MSDYLRENGYTVEHYQEYPFGEDKQGEEVEEWRKDFGEYIIAIRSHTNYWGGKKVIDIYTIKASDLPEPKVSYYVMRVPSLSFFATGYCDYRALEEKVRTEIFPTLKSWAIETL